MTRVVRDGVVCPSPPGFGARIPPGFGATVGEYRDWLVGHDWGGGHVVNVAMARPDLLCSWATDAIGLFDPDYVWNDLARTWQTPGEGERLVARLMGGTAEQRAAGMAEMGRNLEAAAARPGLSILAAENHVVGSDNMRRRAAERAGVRTEVLEGLGHWWMVEDPVRGAEMLADFWGSIAS